LERLFSRFIEREWAIPSGGDFAMIHPSEFPLRPISALIVLVTASFISGCAIHYYDPETEAEHIWGIGHMVMKASAPKEGHRALVRGTDVAGLASGKSDVGSYFVIGWEQRRRMAIIDPNTSVRLEWPRADFLNLRVGSEPPRELNESKSKTGGGN
jgi:hypothetical protein